MADLFGDDSLFAEFDRERDTQNIFIQYDQDESGIENRSRIIFTGAESDQDESDIEDATQNGEQITPGTSAEETRNSMDVEESCHLKEDKQRKGGNAPHSTTYQGNFEKNKLRQIASVIDSTRFVSEEQSPAVQVVFQNNKFAKKYRARIEQFITGLAQQADRKDFTKMATDLSIKPVTVATCVDINDKLPTEKRNTRMWQAHGIIGCAQFYNGFMVDSRGWPHDEDEPRDFTSGDIPKYFHVFDDCFPPKEDTIEQPQRPARSKNSCFNCGGDHRLSECTSPKDHNRIRAKRQEHMENKAAKASNPGRYHEDPELDPNRAQFRAGNISGGLRDAMGLKEDQLPSYIYRMRIFGYPPGWMMEANRNTSALAMYDRDGRETNLRGESLEDGEYSEQASAVEQFDVNKIIEYPGFTVPVPPGFVDESENQDLPPIQPHQLKQTLMDDMASREAAKKRGLEDEEEVKKIKKLKTDDMDIEDEDEESPVPQKTSTPAAEGEKGGERREGEKAGSPSMDNLQQEYQRLVQELDSQGDSSSSITANGNATQGTAPSTSQAEPSTSTHRTTSSTTSTSSSSSEVQRLREKNFSFSSMSSISRDFGTPILVREKSFKSLPDPEKFSQGVEEHIPFENLPDSVGTFEKMKNIFTLIRNKFKKPKK